MSEPIKFWVFKKSPWKPVYKTLADVPEGVRCVVTRTGYQLVAVRKRNAAYDVHADGTISDYTRSTALPNILNVIQVLDPIPETITPKCLADLPDGRCVRLTNYSGYIHWMSNHAVFQRNPTGLIERVYWGVGSKEALAEVMDIVAEVNEVQA